MALAGLDVLSIPADAVAALLVLRHDALQVLPGQGTSGLNICQQLVHRHPAVTVHVQGGLLRMVAQQIAEIHGDLPLRGNGPAHKAAPLCVIWNFYYMRNLPICPENGRGISPPVDFYDAFSIVSIKIP